MKRILLLTVVMQLLVSYSVFASAKPATLIDILNIASLADPALSADGNYLAYTKEEANWQKNKRIKDIWVKAKDNKHYQLTNDVAAESALQFHPKKPLLSYLAKGKNSQYKDIIIADMNTKKQRNITQDFESSIKQYQWVNSTTLYFTAPVPLSKQVKQQIADQDDMWPFDEPRSKTLLWQVSIETGEIKAISANNKNVRHFHAIDQGNTVAISYTQGTTLDEIHNADVFLLTPRTGKQRQLTNNNHAEFGFQLSPNGKQLMYFADVNENNDYYYDANLFVVDLASGKRILLAKDKSFEVEKAKWAADGQHIYIQGNMGLHSELWRIKIDDSEHVQLTNGQHTVKSWYYQPELDKHIIELRKSRDPGDLWSLTATDTRLKRESSWFADINDKLLLPEQQLITYKTRDGATIEGLLSLPFDYKKGQKVPLVVYTHGGPRSQDQYGVFHWRTYIPALASRGYAFFTINYRGGRGYGDEFLRNMVGGYFNTAHQDVMDGIDYLIDQGIADGDKLIKVGWSAGGHMTNKLITYTNRFKAASSGAGAVDWVSMYGETDLRYHREYWFGGGKPWQQDAPLDTYREHSPLKDMWKVTTPTIIYVGEKDVRVPPTQSIMLYRALKDLGVPSKLYVAKREKHGFVELRHRLFKMNADLDWFERHVFGRDYVWEKAPEQ